MRNHYQEAIDIYKRLLLENRYSWHIHLTIREFVAINVYIAMCYYKLDYFDVSQEVLGTYLSHYPDSIIAMNLKACNIYKLYNGKAAETELRILTDELTECEFAQDVIKHNMVIIAHYYNFSAFLLMERTAF
jgi:intraflagellar transport protein 56